MEQGLRARSKARRRTAIERTAMRLFAENGYDATTVADIAAAVEVAPRTVTLYFPTKLDLALSFSNAASQRLIDHFGVAAQNDTALDVILRWLKHQLDTEAEGFALHRSMLEKNPFLRGTQTPITAETARVTVSALARDLDRSIDDVVVTLASGAISGVILQLFALDPAHTDTAAALNIAERLLRAATNSVQRTDAAQTAGNVHLAI